MTRLSRRSIFALAALALPILAGPAAAQSATEQEIVDKAKIAIEALRRDPDFEGLNSALARAKAVVIIPSLLKAGFIVGAEGGSGVLLARDANEVWSSPSFYTMVSGSVGLQIGAQDAEVVLTIMTDKGLDQVLKSQFKLGADASIAVGPKGMGLEAATTAALGADVYSFAKTRGAYAGGSFEGSFLYVREEWNKNYYGRAVTSRQIVMERQVSNPGADALRQALVRR